MKNKIVAYFHNRETNKIEHKKDCESPAIARIYINNERAKTKKIDGDWGVLGSSDFDKFQKNLGKHQTKKPEPVSKPSSEESDK